MPSFSAYPPLPSTTPEAPSTPVTSTEAPVPSPPVTLQTGADKVTALSDPTNHGGPPAKDTGLPDEGRTRANIHVQDQTTNIPLGKLSKHRFKF